MTLTPAAERSAVELSVPVNDLGLSQLYKHIEVYFKVHHLKFSKNNLNAVFVRIIKIALFNFRLPNQYTISIDLLSIMISKQTKHEDQQAKG